jgi:hypothetical protein
MKDLQWIYDGGGWLDDGRCHLVGGKVQVMYVEVLGICEEACIGGHRARMSGAMWR